MSSEESLSTTHEIFEKLKFGMIGEDQFNLWIMARDKRRDEARAPAMTRDTAVKVFGLFTPAAVSRMISEARAPGVPDLEFERDQYKKAAEEWMAEYDALKAKYEPTAATTSSPPVPQVPSEEEIRAEIEREVSKYTFWVKFTRPDLRDSLTRMSLFMKSRLRPVPEEKGS